VPLATALFKTFLLRILDDSRAGRNPTRVVVPLKKLKKAEIVTGDLRKMQNEVLHEL
jgi:hypothetical protein